MNLLTLMADFGFQNMLALEAFIQKLRVKTEYLGAIRVKTIQGFSHLRQQDRHPDGRPKLDKNKNVKMKGNAPIELGNCNSIKFACDDFPPAKELTITQYFQKKYKIQLKHPAAFVLNCGTDEKPTWIPAELCTVMPGQAYRGRLSEEQTAKMILIAARG